MKFVIVLLFAVVAAVSAFRNGYNGYSAYSGYKNYGFDKPQNFARERRVNFVNGIRQVRVNHIAESVGASDGTFQVDGVPGTGVGNGHLAGGAFSYRRG